jgi:hypothetical protein
MGHCGKFVPAQWATAQVWSCIIGHCGKFVPAQWATAQVWSCIIGHCGKFGPAQWDTAPSLVLHNGPLRQVLSCTMGLCEEWSGTVKICDDFHTIGHSAGLEYELWAMAHDLAMCYGSYNQMNYHRTESHNIFIKACYVLSRDNNAINVNIKRVPTLAYTT